MGRALASPSPAQLWQEHVAFIVSGGLLSTDASVKQVEDAVDKGGTDTVAVWSDDRPAGGL